jgi:hypothetical protein
MEGMVGLLLLAVVYIGLVLVPVMRILDRLGFNRWLALIALVPGGNVFGLWMLAFSKWPAVESAPRHSDQWSDADNAKFKRLLKDRLGP